MNGWIAVSERFPEPHRRYAVKRGNYCPTYFVAIPCYGMHEPWWVPSTPQGETDPIAIEKLLDSWRPIDDEERP